jgi:hypothetical protein
MFRDCFESAGRSAPLQVAHAVYIRFSCDFHNKQEFISLKKKFWVEEIAYCPMRHVPARKRRVKQFFYCNMCIRYRGNVFLPSRCLAAIGLYTYRHTDRWEGFMKYAVEMGSGTMIYVPSFTKIGSTIQKLIGRDTQTAWRSYTPIFMYFPPPPPNKGSGLKALTGRSL